METTCISKVSRSVADGDSLKAKVHGDQARCDIRCWCNIPCHPELCNNRAWPIIFIEKLRQAVFKLVETNIVEAQKFRHLLRAGPGAPGCLIRVQPTPSIGLG